jgi:aminoglycoside 6-adenylyltransferase
MKFYEICLFEQVAIEVADILEYQYPYEEANKVKDYLNKK